ncbi:MAG: TetR/AcrR family transcriptional regulator [Flavobacteriaceae bacterium]|nr:TetR/AcrR family transcriptional regulator [Flavobacteriaceae bacterium]
MILTKAERTSQFIVQKTAIIFNRNGYTGTSLSDITEATGLTKGAIYGNFKNKEELALAAFNFTVKYQMDEIKAIINTIESPLAKLFAITNFHRNYYAKLVEYGGCPIVNVGIDANHTNPALFTRVKYVIDKIQGSIASIIEDGIFKGEIKDDINAMKYGVRIYSLIQGAVFTAMMSKDEQSLKDMMNHVDHMIQNELKK